MIGGLQIVSYGLPWFQIWGCRLRQLDLEQRHFDCRGHVFVMIDDGARMKADLVSGLGHSSVSALTLWKPGA